MDEVSKDILRVLIARSGAEEIRGVMGLWESQYDPSALPSFSLLPSEDNINNFIERAWRQIDYYVGGVVPNEEEWNRDTIIECRERLTELIHKRISYLAGSKIGLIEDWEVNRATLLIEGGSLIERYRKIDKFVNDKVEKLMGGRSLRSDEVLTGSTYLFEGPNQEVLNSFYKAVFPLERFV